MYHTRRLQTPNTFLHTVLDPVPTTGLTSADIPELIIRVRDSMVARLHLISATAVHGDTITGSAKSTKGAGDSAQLLSLQPHAPTIVPVCGVSGEGSDEDAVLVDRP